MLVGMGLNRSASHDESYVRGLGYHGQMHRTYRAVRARVAQRMSVIHPRFAETVLEDFRAMVKYLRLDEKRDKDG